MSSHVPFLAVRPDDQFSSDIKTPARRTVSRATNALSSSSPSSQLPMDSPPPITRAPPTYAATRLPSAIRFPLVLILSLSLSTLLYTLTASVSGIELATAAQAVTAEWQVVALLGWKVLELLTAWLAGYDYEDLAALAILTNQPYYYLLHAFWSISLLPIALSMLIDTIVVAFPFALLRPLTRAHDPNTPKSNNQALAMDYQLMLLTAALGATVYAVTFYLSYYANLTVFVIQHFHNVPSLEARDSTIQALLGLFAITGFAAMMFLFRPTIAAAGKAALTEPKSIRSRARSQQPKKFNPETATLGETFAYNLGYGQTGWSHRAEVLGKRTLVLAACTFANTFVRVYGTVEGPDLAGTLGYAGLWAGANVMVGVAYGLLSNEE